MVLAIIKVKSQAPGQVQLVGHNQWVMINTGNKLQRLYVVSGVRSQRGHPDVSVMGPAYSQSIFYRSRSEKQNMSGQSSHAYITCIIVQKLQNTTKEHKDT